MNEPGSLAQVASVIGEADGNIDNIKMTNRVHDYTEILIDLEVWDLKHLNDIIAGLAGQGHGDQRGPRRRLALVVGKEFYLHMLEPGRPMVAQQQSGSASNKRHLRLAFGSSLRVSRL